MNTSELILQALEAQAIVGGWLDPAPPTAGASITLDMVQAQLMTEADLSTLNLAQLQQDYDILVLSSIKAEATALASAKTEQNIVTGLISSVLGTAHTYPSTREGQSDVSGLAQRANVDGVGGKLWCADAGGVWQRRTHTADQIIQLGREMITWVEQHRDAYETTLAQIQAATTVDEVQAIIDGM